MTFTVRRLTPDDHEALRALRLRALAGEPSAFGSTHERELAFTADVWRSRLAPDGRPHYGGFDDGAGLVGLAAAGRLDGADAHVGELLAMWVDPAARGTGLARRLVDEVVAWLDEQGCTMVRLWVTDGNERAERLYLRLGFARTGIRERRERDGADEVMMEATVPRLRSNR